jgi:hypothetical protein
VKERGAAIDRQRGEERERERERESERETVMPVSSKRRVLLQRLWCPS